MPCRLAVIVLFAMNLWLLFPSNSLFKQSLGTCSGFEHTYFLLFVGRGRRPKVFSLVENIGYYGIRFIC